MERERERESNIDEDLTTPFSLLEHFVLLLFNTHHRELNISNMSTLSIQQKYGNRVPSFHHNQRQWPNVVLKKSPILFSTDLRDGNQALRNPMVRIQQQQQRKKKFRPPID